MPAKRNNALNGFVIAEATATRSRNPFREKTAARLDTRQPAAESRQQLGVQGPEGSVRLCRATRRGAIKSELLAEPAVRNSAIEAVARRWLSLDRTAAAAWLTTTDLPHEKRSALLSEKGSSG